MGKCQQCGFTIPIAMREKITKCPKCNLMLPVAPAVQLPAKSQANTWLDMRRAAGFDDRP